MASKNLLLNTDFTRGFNNWTTWGGSTMTARNAVVDNTEVSGFTKVFQTTIDNSNQGVTQQINNLPAGTYTLSGWIKSSVANKDYLQLYYRGNVNTNYYLYGIIGSRATTAWQRVYITFTTTEETLMQVQVGRGSGDTASTTFMATGFQLEEGSTLTSWVPGTEPNMVRNSGLLDGLNYWNQHMDTGGVITTRGIVDDLASPTTKAYYLKADKTGGLWQAASTVSATVGKTYTASVVAKGSAGTSMSYGWEGLSKTQVLTQNYQMYSYTFTYSGTYNYRFYSTGPGEIWFHSMKIEEGPYATGYVAAQADINLGKDRAVISQAQYTIVDYNDKVSLVASIDSTQPFSQQYSPSTETFIPDWTTSNVILTASLFRGSDTTNIINSGDVRSIKWYKLSVIDGVNPVEITSNGQYSVNGKTLTITQNVLNDKDSIDFICEIVYRNPVTQQDMFTRNGVTFNRVRNGGALTKAMITLPNGAYLQNDKVVNYQKNVSNVGRNLERYTDYISGGAGYWSSAGPTGYTAVTRTVVNEPTAPTGKVMEITYPETLASSAGTHKPPISTLTSGMTYSWSVWIKASRAVSAINIGQEQGGTKTVALTTSWQKFTHTFIANSSSYFSFVFYMVPTAGDKIWIHSLKLEEGPNPTSWSMAPEDVPTIDQALGNNSWLLRKYDSTRAGTYIPTYNDINDKPASITQTIAGDAVDLVSESNTVATPYIGHLQSSIYSDVKRSIPISFQNHGPASIYVNNTPKHQDTAETFYGTNTSSTALAGRNMALDTAITYMDTGTFGTADSVPFSLSPDFITSIRNQYVTISAYVEGKIVQKTGTHYGIDICVTYTDATTTWLNLTKGEGLPTDGIIPGQRYSFTEKVLDKPIQSISSLSMFVRTYDAVEYFIIRDMKVEVGQTATPWSPAPEDARNLLEGGTTEKTSASEFLQYVDIAPIIDTYGLVPYTISFDIKGAVAGTAQVYQQNGSTSKYSFSANVPVTTSYVRQKVTVTPVSNIGGAYYDPNVSMLAFYCTYGTGCIPSVKNVKIQLGSATGTPAYTVAHEDFSKTAILNLEQGWNTIDMLWLANARRKNGIWNTKVGGTNLLRDSRLVTVYSNNSTLYPVDTKQMSDEGGSFYRVRRISTGSNPNTLSLYNNILKSNITTDIVGKKVTLSVKARVSNPITATVMSYAYTTPTTNFSMHNQNVPLTTEWTTITQTIASFPSYDAGIRFMPYQFSIPNGLVDSFYVDLKEWKIEIGNLATPWTPSPADSGVTNPNTFSKAAFGLNAFYSIENNSQSTSLIAKCQLIRGSIIDTTNVQYQWYKQDATIATDQGGGIGWLKLTGSSLETGFNTDTLSIPAGSINSVEYYKCIIRDTQVDSVTYNGYFSDIVSVSNVAMPIDVRVETNGTVILNGQTNKTLVAKLYQMGREIDPRGDQYNYKWYRYLSNGTKDTTWAGGIGFKTGKTLTITNADVVTKCTFAIEIE